MPPEFEPPGWLIAVLCVLGLAALAWLWIDFPN